jgi:hypothetical protein
MRRSAVVGAAIFAVGLAWLAPTAAQAGFGDCRSPDYLRAFPVAPAAATVDCVEVFRVPVTTPAGTRHIRGITDLLSDWAVPAEIVAAAEQGAREAAAAMPALGDYALDDITILLLDDRMDWSTPASGGREANEAVAITDGRRAAGRAGECLVTLYGLAVGTTVRETPVTVAHEVFHCLQYASLPPALMDTYGTGGDWWIEGTAEYFSAVAVSVDPAETDRSSLFDAAVRAGRALNEMEHESAPFFFWLGETRGGLGAIMPFIRAMSASGGATAQQAAMRAVLDDGAWLDFAEAYGDNAIAHPRGGMLSLAPDFGAPRPVTAATTLTIPLPPFVLTLGELAYDCGTWGHGLSPTDANLSTQLGKGAPWELWPAEVDARDGRPADLRYVGLHTGPARQTLRVDIDRRRSCAPCAGSDLVDLCLVGQWEVTSGGPVEWMKSQGVPIPRETSEPERMTLMADGSYTAPPRQIELGFDFGGTGPDRGEGKGSAAFGRWSVTEDGRLNLCVDMAAMAGFVENSETGNRVSVAEVGAGTQSGPYSCAEGSRFDHAIDMPGLPPMPFGYSYMGPAPEPPPPGEGP